MKEIGNLFIQVAFCIRVAKRDVFAILRPKRDFDLVHISLNRS